MPWRVECSLLGGLSRAVAATCRAVTTGSVVVQMGRDEDQTSQWRHQYPHPPDHSCREGLLDRRLGWTTGQGAVGKTGFGRRGGHQLNSSRRLLDVGRAALRGAIILGNHHDRSRHGRTAGIGTHRGCIIHRCERNQFRRISRCGNVG